MSVVEIIQIGITLALALLLLLLLIAVWLVYRRVRPLVTVLGIPGIALGIFYLLLNQFDFDFSTIDPFASAIIAILFLIIVGGITFYALYRWTPTKRR